MLFDLDGTLADSLADITASTNVCLAEAGLPTHDESSVRGFVGHGIAGLVERALGPHATPQRVTDLLIAIRAHYREHCTEHTRLYPGIAAMLDRLGTRGIAMAVVSNKPDDMTQRVVETLMPEIAFGFVTGERDAIPRKPSPIGILTACHALGVAPSAALYVGDTTVDIEGARAAGVPSVGVAWGFRNPDTLRAAGADHLVEHPDELLLLV